LSSNVNECKPLPITWRAISVGPYAMGGADGSTGMGALAMMKQRRGGAAAAAAGAAPGGAAGKNRKRQRVVVAAPPQ